MDRGETFDRQKGLSLLRPGESLCAICETADELRGFLSSFIADGIARNEMIVGAVDAAAATAALEGLRKRGIDPEPLRDRGGIRFLDPAASSLPDGTFDPERMIGIFREESDRAERDGYASLRVVADMSPALAGPPEADRLAAYEEKLDALLGERRMLAGCLYDARKFPPARLLRILPTHSLAFVGGKILESIECAATAAAPAGDSAHRVPRRRRSELERLVRERTEELRMREASVGALVNASPDAAILIDRHGTVLAVNAETARRFGRTPDELKGRCAYDFFPPEVAIARRETTEEVIRTGRPARHEDIREGRVIESHLYPVCDDRGEVSGIAVFGIDVTERRAAEVLLSEIAESLSARTGIDYLRALVAFLHRTLDVDYGLVGRLQEDGRTVRTVVIGVRGTLADNVAYDLRGAPCEKVVGHDFVCIPREVARLFPEDRMLSEIGAQSYAGFPLSGSDGKALGLIALFGTRPMDEGKTGFVRSLLQIVGVRAAAEIERMETDVALRRATEEWERTFDAVPDLVCLLDNDYRIVRMNRPMAERLGRDPQACVGTYCYDTLHGLAAPPDFCPHSRTMRDGRAHSAEVACERLKGHFHVTTTPLTDGAGRHMGTVHIARDITDRIRSEKALRASEERYRGIFDLAADAIFVADVETGMLLDANPQARKMIGRDLDEIRRMHQTELHPPEAVAEARRTFAEAVDRQDAGITEADVVRKDGRRVPVEVSSAGFIDVGGRRLHMGIFRDVSERMRAEEALRESEQKLRALIETTDTGYVIIDGEGRVLDANAEYARLAGYDAPRRILGKSVTEWTAEHDRGRNAGEVRKCLESGSVRNLEIDYVNGEGRVTPVEINAAVLRTADGPRILTLCRDITERRQAEAALRENEKILRDVLESLPVGVWILDADGRITHANPATVEIWGGARPVGARGFGETRAWRQETGRLLSAEEWASHRAVSRGETTLHEEIGIETFDGKRKVILNSAIPLRAEGGRILGVVVLNQDITERKAAESALRESEAELLEAQRVGHVGSWQWDVASDVVSWSEELFRIFGRDVTSGVPDFREQVRVYTPESWKRLQAAVDRSLRTGEPYEVDLELVRPDGSTRWIVARGETVRAADGRITGLRGTAYDITDRKRGEAALRESEMRFRGFAESADGVFWITSFDPERILYVNPSFERIWGMSPTELDRNPRLWMDSMHPDDRARVTEAFERWIRGEPGGRYDVQYRIRRPDGRIRWIADRGFVLRQENGRISRVAGIAEDITERKRVEEALRESEERYRAIFDSGGDAFLVFDLEGRILDANPMACELYGYSLEELTRLAGSDIVDPSCARNFDAFRKTGRGDWFRVESLDVRKGGERFPVDVHGTRLQYRGRESLLAIVRDITDRKRMEATLRASLQEKEILLREIHHRVKNNLQVVTSLLALQERAVPDPAAAAALAESRGRIRSIAMIHERLYRADDLAGVDFAGYVRRLYASLLQTYGIPAERIRLRTEIEGVRPEISTAIPCALILNELLVNVLKHAYPPGTMGEIDVTMRRDGPGWMLRVADRGAGLPAGFDAARASTLGLRIVALLAEQMGGTMSISGDGGTTVTIAFPGADVVAREAKEEGP